MLVDDWGPPLVFLLSGMMLAIGVHLASVWTCMVAMLCGLFAVCAGVDRWLELRRRERG